MRFLILLSVILVMCIVSRKFRKVSWFIIKWTGIVIGCFIGVIMIGDVIYGRWLESQHRRNVLYELDHNLGLGRYNQEQLERFIKVQR